MVIRFWLLALSALISTQALADNSYPTPIKEGVPGHRPGDIVAPVSDEQVAAWCDFNKQIVVTKTKVLCAYVGGKVAAAPRVQAAALSPKAKNPKVLAKKSGRAQPKELEETPYEMGEYETS